MFDDEDVHREIQARIRSRDSQTTEIYENALCREVESEMKDYLTHGSSAKKVALYAAVRFIAYMEKIPEYELAEILHRKNPAFFEEAKHV